MKNIKIFLYLTYILGIVALIVKVNPTLLTTKTMSNAGIKAPIWKTVSLEKPTQKNATESAPIFYRQTLDRNAAFSVPKKSFDLAPEWLTENLNVGVHGASKASVVADADRVYVGSDSSWFYCFDKKGRLLWKNYLGDSTRGIHSTAILDDTSVYVGSYRGTLYRLDKKTGKILWMRILGDTIGASPSLDGEDLLVVVETVHPDGYMLRIHKNSGRIIWRTPLFGEQSHSSPTLDTKSGTIVLGANNSTLQGFDYKTGKRIWQTRVGGQVKSTIAVHEGIGYATSWGKELLAFKVSDGSILWKGELSAKSQVSPLLLPKSHLVLAADVYGRMFSFDMTTGKPAWKIPQKMDDQKSSPILLSLTNDEKILYYCEDYQLCLISEKGRIENKWRTRGKFSGSPFIDQAGENLYLSYNEGGLEAFRIK